MTAFSKVLETAQRGDFHVALTEELAKVVLAAQATKRKGSITLVLEVVPDKSADGNVVELVPKFSSKIPTKPTEGRTIFFCDEQGNLFRTDPRQTEMALGKVIEGGKGNLSAVASGGIFNAGGAGGGNGGGIGVVYPRETINAGGGGS